MPELFRQVETWINQDPDRQTSQQLGELLNKAKSGQAEAKRQLTALFTGRLKFGTAGLRAPLGPGPQRMNRVVVSQTSAGIASWLKSNGATSGRILVGFDGRTNSEVFARDAAEIFAGAGFLPLLTAYPTPTPVVAFGIKHFNCIAGIVVTASHNPASDNGYKVYLGDGRQINTPVDEQIFAEIQNLADYPIDRLVRGRKIVSLRNELFDPYIRRAAKLVSPEDSKHLDWVYTALHGVGARVVDRVVQLCGFTPGIPVVEQLLPNPAFPTTPFPNPEEPGTLDLALSLAELSNVDLVIANDPDADRCAVAAKFSTIDGSRRFRMLTGDELGVLLAADYLDRHVAGTYAASVVSSTLLAKMCHNAGVPYQTTLTGFKWISRVPDLCFGYEEALGYCCDPQAVADKDGITALVNMLRIGGKLKAANTTVESQLDKIYSQFGLHLTSQIAVRTENKKINRSIMKKLRTNPPESICGIRTTFHDLALGSPERRLPPTDGVEFTGEGLHVVVRPSGTEPKLKCYLEVFSSPDEAASNLHRTKIRCHSKLTQARSELAHLLNT